MAGVLDGLGWAEVERRAAFGRGAWLTFGEACTPGAARWASGCFGWGAIAARLVVASHAPDRGPKRGPWVSGWLWAPGVGVMHGRSNAGLVGLGALVLDVDEAEGVGTGDVAGSAAWRERLRAALGPDVRAVVWPSRSWGRKAGPRSKALVPLARPLRAELAAAWCAELVLTFARLGVELDAACLTLGQNQDLPSLPLHPRAPEVEVWPAEPSGSPSAWASLEAWPGVPLDPDAPRGSLPSLEGGRASLEAERLEAVRLEGEAEQRQAWSAPALDAEPWPLAEPDAYTSHAAPLPRQAREGADPQRAERRARARLEAWGRATIDATVDKIRAAHWGGRKVSGFKGGVWLARLALTQVGPLGPALDAAEVDAVVDAEVRSLGLERGETKEVLDHVRRKAAKRGGLDVLPDTLRDILRDFYAEGGR